MGKTQNRIGTAGILLLLVSTVTNAQGGAASERRLTLDGPWEFAVDSVGFWTPANVRQEASWRVNQVPGSWQSQNPDLRNYQGVGWYFRRFEAPPTKPGETVLLTFGAVDYFSEVFVNGSPAGNHEGGFTPFTCDIGRLVRPGANTLLLRVVDPVLADEGTEGFRYSDIPYGKQTWYVQTSGPWQTVYLTVVPERRMTRVHLTPDMDGTVVCDIGLTGPAAAGDEEKVSVLLKSPDGREKVSAEKTFAAGQENVRVELRVSAPVHWSPDHPALYTARVTLSSTDTHLERFGFRSFEAREGRLFLNGKPFYMIGALDQDFYATSVYTPTSVETLRDEMEKAKRLGLNTLRCHIKIPDPRYLDAADEAGVLVWYEIPNWGTFTPDAARRGEETLRAALERDWNHPSLVALSLINESWGIDLGKSEQRAWILDAYHRLKALARGRLVVDNSACQGNFHVATDINDYHTYWAIPERRRRFEATIEEMAGRPAWLFSPHGDSRETGKEPLVLSEFGTWGLPDPVKPLPWWIERKFFDQGTVHPYGFEERFANLGYRTVFGTWTGLSKQSQEAQGEALKFQIEELRRHPELSGYVITEFTDIMWECNGLLDIWRRTKSGSGRMADVQRPRVIVPRVGKHAVWDTQHQEIGLWFSNFGDPLPAGGRVEWRTPAGDRGMLVVPASGSATVLALGSITVPPMRVERTGQIRVDFQVLDANGVEVARNHTLYAVYPFPRGTDSVQVEIHDPAGRLKALAGAPGIAAGPGGGDRVVIAATVDDAVKRFLRAGRSVVCLVDSQTVFPAGFPLTVLNRDTGGYDGNWASALNWVRDVPALRAPFPSAPRLGWETDITGLPLALRGVPDDKFTDVLAGLFVGWLHSSAAYVTQLSAGKGKLLLCTIPVAPVVRADPFAASLLHSLVRYAAAREIRPQIRWEP
jgi:hypothetical protein